MSDEPIETECPECGALCIYDGEVYDALSTQSCDELDRYRSALERIVEIGEDPTSNRRDLMQAFKVADDALNRATPNACATPKEEP